MGGTKRRPDYMDNQDLVPLRVPPGPTPEQPPLILHGYDNQDEQQRRIDRNLFEVNQIIENFQAQMQMHQPEFADESSDELSED